MLWEKVVKEGSEEVLGRAVCGGCEEPTREISTYKERGDTRGEMVERGEGRGRR